MREKEGAPTEETAGIHVRREEVALARRGAFGGETRHVGCLHDVLQVFARVPGVTPIINETVFSIDRRKERRTTWGYSH